MAYLYSLATRSYVQLGVIDIWSANRESVTDCITFRIDTLMSLLYPFRNIIMYCELLFT
jgi:hypothetical protein